MMRTMRSTLQLKGSHIVFTGFRDNALRTELEKRGAVVTGSVSGMTSMVVFGGTRGEGSNKALFARDKGVPLLSREAFVARYKLGPLTRPQRSYLVWDNGGSPFRVTFDKTCFWVDGMDPKTDDDDELEHADYTVRILRRTPYINVFIGKSPSWALYRGKEFDGNSMLFRLNNGQYVFVGYVVYRFSVPKGEVITKFVSEMGNNGVPYPFAVSGKYYYFMLDAVCVPRAMLAAVPDQDLYHEYFDMQLKKTCDDMKVTYLAR